MNKKPKTKTLAAFLILFVAISLLGTSIDVSARQLSATAPYLGNVLSFAVIGAEAVTSSGATILNGDLGISPGNLSSITGFPPGIVNGTTYAADAVAGQAQVDATTIFTSLGIQPCDADLTGQDLGGMTLTPGVYCFDTSAGLTGTLTLDAQGDPYAVWVFKMGSTLDAANGSSVTYINSPQQICNVFWQVGSSATIGTTSSFFGNIFASESVSMNTGANLLGRAVALNAAVTLLTNNITPLFCYVAPNPTATNTLLQNVTALPDSGGAPLNQTGGSSWILGIIGLLCVVALIFGVLIFRKTERSN